MPELPEVESVRRQLEPELVGRRIEDVTYQPQRRFLALDKLTDRTVGDVRRRGKFLICRLDADLELVVHLGMTGSLRFTASTPCDSDGTDHLEHVRARLALDDGRELLFNDPRRFGRIAAVPTGDYTAIPMLTYLGPEPLTDDFDVDTFANDLRATRAPVKSFLLTQRPVAGVGNIYADESLWRARIHPASRRVGPERAARLRGAIRQVLEEAIEREGTTFRDYQMVDGQSGRNAAYLDVYGKAGQPCPRCGSDLRRVVISGRGTTYCPTCQHP